MTSSSLLSDLVGSNTARALAAQARHQRMMRDVLDQNRVGVNAMLEHQRAFDFIGKGVMQERGPAMDGAGVMRMARGGMKSQLLEGADVMGARGVVKSQGLMTGVDVAGVVRGVVKSQDLLNRAGVCDALKDINAGVGRVAMQSGAARASRATAGLLAASTVSGKRIMRWTSPIVRSDLARIGPGAALAGVSQHLAHHWRGYTAAGVHDVLPRGYPKLHQAIVAAAAGRGLYGLTGLGLTKVDDSAVNHLLRSTGWQPRWATGLTFSNQAALRELMAATISRDPAWMRAYSGGAEMQRLFHDVTRGGLGVTGMDVLRGRGIWDSVGAVRAHNALVGVRSPWADYARVADLFAPGVLPTDLAMAPEPELFVPAPGDILDAVGGDIVTADTLDGELVPARRLDVAWEWVCANPGHFVRSWNIVWPDASVHERNALRRQAATIGVAYLVVGGAVLTANTVGFVIGVLGVGLAWQALFDELSKLQSERDEQR